MKRFISFSLLLILLCGNIASAQKRLFFLDVSVENDRNEPITGLKAEHIRLLDKDKPKEVKVFQNAHVPMSVGFLVDVSPSMRHNNRNSKVNRIDWARIAILNFIEKSRSDNEYFVMSFADEAVLLTDFTNNLEAKKVVEEPSEFKSRKGGVTRLFDALASSIEKAGKAKNDKKVLFIITDGQDYGSSSHISKIEQLLKENLVTVNFMAVHDRDNAFDLLMLNQREDEMKKLAKISGGWVLNSTEMEHCLTISSWLASMLQHQYRIGFEADSTETRGWRNLKIDLRLSKDEKKSIGPTTITHRQGYYPLSATVIDK